MSFVILLVILRSKRLHSPAMLLGSSDDLDQSVACFQKAALLYTGSPHSKFRAALRWAAICDQHRSALLLDAYKQAMVLLPQVVWLGDSVEDRYKQIIDAGSICAEAVAAAITRSDYQAALEWLEEGRSIVWKQTLQLRTPVDDISAVNPALATKLKKIAHDLDQASSRKTLDATQLSNEHDTQQHRRLAERWEKVVDRARNIPGFETFLRPRAASELILSAHSGPVVIINVHKSRCDALVLKPGCTTILHVPLVNFSFQKAVNVSTQWENLVRSRGSNERAFIKRTSKINNSLRKTLAVLWTEVVEPVLEVLGITVGVHKIKASQPF